MSRGIVVAEVGQAHDGSLGLAHAFIDAATAAGADAIKFQTHIAAAESTPDEPWRVKFSRQDASRYVDGVRFNERANANPVDKTVIQATLRALRHTRKGPPPAQAPRRVRSFCTPIRH